MIAAKRALLLTLVFCVADARGQANRPEPHIGYLYPAGGKQGTVIRVNIGGQRLRGASDVYISGEGVRAAVIKHYPPLRNLNREQRAELGRRMRETFEKRWAELAREGRVSSAPPWRKLGLPGRRMAGPNRKDDTAREPVELPEHPLLENIEDKSLRELLHVRDALLNFRKRQINAQIAEIVAIEVTIDADAPPGDRELRLGTRLGLTNPMVFQVGVLPETRELEPNCPVDFDPLPPEAPLELPILLNGQIMPGDVDRFRFHARQGEQLVIQAHARQLIPYLADAVPGWFQATLSLYDSQGHEVAHVDDYRFDPDPVLFYEVPQDGEYELEIHDAIYRGREDFVYRLSLGEQPFITSIFPLGGRTRKNRYVSIDGWNLPTERMIIDAQPDADGIRQKVWGRGGRSSNQVTYALDPLPARSEQESNDNPADAQRITLPQVVNGRIAQPGDVDVFQFNGRRGDVVVAEVLARRLRSPLDSLLRLIDASGNVLAWNDDCEQKDGYLHTEMGLLTHSADSYLRAQLPTDGVYYVQLLDAQNHGGEAYGYRLRVGPPRPDFALRVTPSSLSAFAGRATPISVYVLRKDGFDGEIELVLADAPAGFKLAGARIPAGRDHVRMTLTAPRRRLDEPAAIRFEGHAMIAGKAVSRPAVPAEDVMQAFLYRHLVPSQEFLVAVRGGRGAPPPVELVGGGPVRIPAGGTTEVRIKAPGRPGLPDLELQLSDPPAGVSLQDVAVGPDGLTFVLKADPAAAEPGLADNLIIEGFTEVERPQRGGANARRKQRVSVGFLPAIPIEIVRR